MNKTKLKRIAAVVFIVLTAISMIVADRLAEKEENDAAQPQSLLATSPTIASMISAASAGSTVIVPSGDYSTERVIINKSITLRCATIRTCITKGIWTQVSNITVDGFVLANAAGATAARLEGNSITFVNNEIHGTVKGTSSDADGVNWYGSNDVMRGNYIHNIDVNASTNSLAHVDCFQTWQAQATNAIIENNICDNFYANSNEGTQGVNIEFASGTKILNNYFHTYGKKLDIEGSASNTLVENNIFIGGPLVPGAVQQYGIFSPGPGTVARNNIFWDIRNTNGTSMLYGVSASNSIGNLINVDPKMNGYCSTAYPSIGVLCGVVPVTPTLIIQSASNTPAPTSTGTMTRTPTPTFTQTVTATKVPTSTPTVVQVSTQTPIVVDCNKPCTLIIQ